MACWSSARLCLLNATVVRNPARPGGRGADPTRPCSREPEDVTDVWSPGEGRSRFPTALPEPGRRKSWQRRIHGAGGQRVPPYRSNALRRRPARARRGLRVWGCRRYHHVHTRTNAHALNNAFPRRPPRYQTPAYVILGGCCGFSSFCGWDNVIRRFSGSRRTGRRRLSRRRLRSPVPAGNAPGGLSHSHISSQAWETKPGYRHHRPLQCKGSAGPQGPPTTPFPNPKFRKITFRPKVFCGSMETVGQEYRKSCSSPECSGESRSISSAARRPVLSFGKGFGRGRGDCWAKKAKKSI